MFAGECCKSMHVAEFPAGEKLAAQRLGFKYLKTKEINAKVHCSTCTADEFEWRHHVLMTNRHESYQTYQKYNVHERTAHAPVAIQELNKSRITENLLRGGFTQF
jgi:hypothetical protein